MSSIALKVKKLLAHAASARLTNEAEAEAFAAKAADLMLAHRLTEADLPSDDPEARIDSPVVRVDWDMTGVGIKSSLRAASDQLVMGLGKLHAVEVVHLLNNAVVQRGSRFVTERRFSYALVGRQDDIETLQVLFRFLWAQSVTMADEFIRRRRQDRLRATFADRRAFLLGLLNRVRSRLVAQVVTWEREQQQREATGPASNALIVLRKDRAAAAAFKAKEFPRLSRGRAASTSRHSAYAAGSDAGSRISLGGLGASGRGTRMIGG